MPTIVGILISISRKNLILSYAVQEKSLKLLVFNFLKAEQIYFSAELSMVL